MHSLLLCAALAALSARPVDAGRAGPGAGRAAPGAGRAAIPAVDAGRAGPGAGRAGPGAGRARPGAGRAGPGAGRAAVQALLEAHDLPPSAAELRALGAEVGESLAEIAGDSRSNATMRARAISALAVLPTRAGRAFLEVWVAQNPAASTPSDKLLLRKAALSLGWLGGAAAPGLLGPLLDHADPDVRLDAAIALGLTRSRAAAALLRQRFDRETVARVRTQIGRQLGLVEAAGATATAAASDTK